MTGRQTSFGFGAVDGAKLADGSVGAADLAPGLVPAQTVPFSCASSDIAYQQEVDVGGLRLEANGVTGATSPDPSGRPVAGGLRRSR